MRVKVALMVVAAAIAAVVLATRGAGIAEEPFFDAAKWHHTPTGFRNPRGSVERNRPFLGFAPFFWRRMTQGTETAKFPPDHLVARADALAMLEAAAPDGRLTWVGHATFLIGLDGLNILTDPFFSEHASPLPPLGPRRSAPPGLAIEDLPRIDVVLISHNHYDSFDAATLRALAGRNPDAHVLVPLGLGASLRELGFSRVVELDWYDHAALGKADFQAIPAIHTSSRSILDRDHTLWAGFAITSPRVRLVFTGDTGFGPVFEAIRERIGAVDVALVPIGAYEPRRLMGPVHTNPEQAAKIAQTLGAKLAIGMHWGTIRLSDEPMMEPKERFLAVDLPGLETRVLRIGETVSLEAGAR
jgi:L-ascorbate metabolism protein UlaG (beta-lactamase superfamily)